MTDVRTASMEDVKLLSRVAAAAFYDDPVMSWVLPDADTRLAQLRIAFTGLALGFLPDRGTVHVVDDACVSFWRPPAFDYDAPQDVPGESPFSPDVVHRFDLLGQAMTAAHPHDPHWYLNVLGTVPERQGEGLGARVLAPVLATCDADASPAYLESSNPRNIPFYTRQGFVQTGEIPLEGGPSLYPMWREAR